MPVTFRKASNLRTKRGPILSGSRVGWDPVGILRAYLRVPVETAGERPVVDGIPAQAGALQPVARDARLDGADESLAAIGNVGVAVRSTSHGENI